MFDILLTLRVPLSYLTSSLHFNYGFSRALLFVLQDIAPQKEGLSFISDNLKCLVSIGSVDHFFLCLSLLPLEQ